MEPGLTPASKKEDIINIMLMQWQAIIEHASLDQLDHLSRHINPSMIADMEQLVDQEDIDIQFQRVCQEIRDCGLSEVINSSVREQYLESRKNGA